MDRRILIEDIKRGDCSEDVGLIWDACGEQVAKSILSELPGIVLNIPKNPEKNVVARRISEEYNGHNAASLAIRFKVSVRHVYNILNRKQSEL